MKGSPETSFGEFGIAVSIVASERDEISGFRGGNRRREMKIGRRWRRRRRREGGTNMSEVVKRRRRGIDESGI